MKNSLLALLLLSAGSAYGQSAEDKLFETLHGHASFNVVFAVVGIILIGVLFSLWRLDRKVTKLSEEIKQK